MNRDALLKKYGTESVLVVPSLVVQDIPDRFTPSEDFFRIGMLEKMGRYILRADAEGHPEFQQLIPYVIVSNKKKDRWLAARRIKGDSRLQGQWSLGFGGHVDLVDTAEGVSPVMAALQRELDEELKIVPLAAQEPSRFLGFIRDAGSATSDHLGFLFSVQVNEKTSIKEKDTLEGKWLSIDELIKMYPLFEGWSRYAIDYILQNQKKKAG